MDLKRKIWEVHEVSLIYFREGMHSFALNSLHFKLSFADAKLEITELFVIRIYSFKKLKKL
jgi:hypothetical protein